MALDAISRAGRTAPLQTRKQGELEVSVGDITFEFLSSDVDQYNVISLDDNSIGGAIDYQGASEFSVNSLLFSYLPDFDYDCVEAAIIDQDLQDPAVRLQVVEEINYEINNMGASYSFTAEQFMAGEVSDDVVRKERLAQAKREYSGRADLPKTGRGDAAGMAWIFSGDRVAAATRRFRGDGSRRRRSRDAEIQWRPGRGDAAGVTWIFSGDRVAAAPRLGRGSSAETRHARASGSISSRNG